MSLYLLEFSQKLKESVVKALKSSGGSLPKVGKKHDLLLLRFMRQAERGSGPRLPVPVPPRRRAGVGLRSITGLGTMLQTGLQPGEVEVGY